MEFLQDQQGSGGSERANIGSVRHDSNRKNRGTHALTMLEKRFSKIRLKCRYLLEIRNSKHELVINIQ